MQFKLPIQLLLCLLTLVATGAHAAPAARVEFAIGGVTAKSTAGVVRALAKGASVNAGETIDTNEGRAQLRFTDGGFLSLHNNTVFRIDDYHWEGNTNGKERSFFSLLQGGLRTVTGKIAKVNRKAYLMSTTVATIGIRGTEFTMQLNGVLAGAVAEGEIEVCNAAGCLLVPGGHGYFVSDHNTKPMLSRDQTYLPPPARTAESSGGALEPVKDSLTDSNKTLVNLLGIEPAAATSLLGGVPVNQPAQDVSRAWGTAASGAISGIGSATGAPVGGSVGTLGGTTGTLTGGAGGLINLGF